jgi:inner membrane protein
MLSANAPDIDVIAYFFGGRWTLLQHHRGITHSVIGVLLLGVLIPTILVGLEWAIASWRKTPRRINYRGLLLASLIATATHPLMDWTNNYGVRPFLPWDGRWLYGDLVFIVDPYLLLILCGSCFLLTSNRRAKVVVWSFLAVLVTIMVFLASPQRQASSTALTVARTVWITGIVVFAGLRLMKTQRRLGRSLAIGALTFVVLYWGGLAWAHSLGYRNAVIAANTMATQRGEQFIRAAAMPTVANPFRWLCVAETDRAVYRFIVGTGDKSDPVFLMNSPGAGEGFGSRLAIERFEKPSGRGEQLVASASEDPRAQVLLGFARFPIAHPESDSCIGRTLVQFADLRYTEPGVSRGSFSLSVPVDCPTP